MKLKSIPQSKAKTAWGLLQDVKRAILAEPKRIDMTVFQERKWPSDRGPACGTVGCFAGWVCALRGHRTYDWGVDSRVYEILGHHIDYYTVNGGNNHVFNSGEGDACDRTKPGTKAHARAVIARINKFMRLNQSALKAKKV